MNRFTSHDAAHFRTNGWLDKEQADKLRAQLQEAVRLLSRAHPGMHTCETGQWFTDRDAFLNPKPHPKLPKFMKDIQKEINKPKQWHSNPKPQDVM